MNKYLKITLILCIVIIIGFQLNSTFAKKESTIITDINQLKEFKPVIDEYFDNYFYSIKTGNSANLEKIINDNKLREYIGLLVTSRHSYFEKLNQNLYSYDFSTNLNYAREDGSKYVVNVRLDSSLIYENDRTSKTFCKGDDYLFVLEKVKNRWIIDSIIYDENEAADPSKVNDENYLDNKVKALKEDIKEIDKRIKEVNKIKNDINNSDSSDTSGDKQSIVSSPGGSTITYNRSNAVAYAHLYYNSFHPNYPTFINDCTNFTSQCVYAGCYVSGNAWYCYDYGEGHIPYRWDYTYSWIRVIDFHDWIVSNNGVGPWGYDTTSPELGDIIQFFKTADNTYTHGAVVTKFTNGVACYTGHSQPRYDYPVSEILKPGTGYSKVRYIHVF